MQSYKKRKFHICIFLTLIILIGIWCKKFFQYFFKEKYVFAPSEDEISDEMVIASYNIRCLTVFDRGEKSWFNRADLIIENILQIEPDIIGFQEVTSLQYSYLCEYMKNYGSNITYRDNMLWSEGCPIFYNLNKYRLLDEKTFWLSETPSQMSKSWEAANYRICSYVILEEYESKREIAVFNTHLDHKSEKARKKGIELIKNEIMQLENTSIILLGDFNTTEGTETYLSIAEFMRDSKYEAESRAESNTYHNWGKQVEGSPIDYIFISEGDFVVKKYEVLSKKSGNIYSSDHFPLYVKLENKKG